MSLTETQGNIPTTPSTLTLSKRRPDLCLPYAIEVLARYLTRTIPGTLLVLYQLDGSGRHLNLSHAWGPSAHRVAAEQIRIGEGVSGWTALTKQPIYDANIAMELACISNEAFEQFQSCASEPVKTDRELIGVLTFYFCSNNESTPMIERNLVLASAHLSTYLSSAARRSA